MTGKTFLALVCSVSAAAIFAQDFSAEDLKHSAIIRNGTMAVRMHRAYPLFDIKRKAGFAWNAMPSMKSESLKIVKQDETEIKVCWSAVPGKNAEKAKVAAEYEIVARKDFPGFFVESRVFNKDFIGELKCAQKWGLPIFKQESYPADNGELKIGTAWRKMKPIKYYFYQDGSVSFGFITDGLETRNRSMFTNFNITDFPAKKIGLWLAFSGQIEENECSKIKFVIVPAKNLEDVKKQYEALLQRKDLEPLWKY